MRCDNVPSLFNQSLPTYRQVEAKYMQRERFQKIVEILQKRWPNTHLQLTFDECNHNTQVLLILDNQQHHVVTIERLDPTNDIEIVDIILNYIDRMKKVKRRTIMKELLTVNEM